MVRVSGRDTVGKELQLMHPRELTLCVMVAVCFCLFVDFLVACLSMVLSCCLPASEVVFETCLFTGNTGSFHRSHMVHWQKMF